MRPIRLLALAGLLAAGIPAATVRGQQPYWQRAADPRGGGDPDASDPLRPYNARGARAADVRAYGREPARVEPTRALVASPRRDYFPGQRTGLHPNRNYIAPERLCVPGRRPFLYR